MDSEYSIIGFYIVFMILLNIFSIGFGTPFINNADFRDDVITEDYSSDPFGTLNFLLFAEVPTTSKYSNALDVFRLVYWLIVIPYSFLILFIIVRMIIPWSL